MSVFSITYDARKQIMFEEALKEKDSTKAKQILESFPKGQNNSEKIESNDLAKTCDMIRYYETQLKIVLNKLNIDFLEN